MASRKDREKRTTEADEQGRPSQAGAERGQANGDPPTDAPQAEADEAAGEHGDGSAEETIEALSRQLAELEDRHLRLVAEFDNFRKRTFRERAQQEERAQAELVKQLLESLDDLNRVSELGSKDHEAASIIEGVRLVEVKLRRALEQFGLKPIDAIGKPFDPELHEAMVTVATDEPGEDEVVSQELAKGYVYRDTLLRPSLVEVKKYQPDEVKGDSGRAEDES